MTEYLKPKNETEKKFPEYPSGVGWRLEDVDRLGIPAITEDINELFFNLRDLGVTLPEKYSTRTDMIQTSVRSMAETIFSRDEEQDKQSRFSSALTTLSTELRNLASDDEFWNELPDYIQSRFRQEMAGRNLEILRPDNEEVLMQYVGPQGLTEDEKQTEIRKYETIKKGFSKEYIREKFKRYVTRLQMLLLQGFDEKSGNAN